MSRSIPILVPLALSFALCACTTSRRPTGRADSGTIRTTDSGIPGRDGGSSPGESLLFVVSLFDVGMADPAGDPSIVPGVDIDMRVSDDLDEVGCFAHDAVSPPPDNEPGVDNQMGPILSSLGGSIDISGSIAEAIATGDLLLLIEVTDVNDLLDDPSVRVEMFAATSSGLPLLDSGGRLAPGQSFSADLSYGSATGRIVAGRVFTDPSTLALPAVFGDPTAPELDLLQAQLRFSLGAAGLDDGILAGGLDVDATVTALVALDPDLPEDLARSILEGQADLEPDAMGICQQLSVGYVFEAVPAIRR